ncbi:uncharacterized protein Thert_01755 [Thermoanaerobacterium thermosaccharolyticum]|uniref:Uncharacterized protein n=1 Tax=Thermoanaerobacterium thermosaccharolyticum TaxID=1517 RepID=A0A223HZ55_THETR|nr:uncharacterized protein Thert_01755 [Thermoanaerobacterium thermosaccharolyticum]
MFRSKENTLFEAACGKRLGHVEWNDMGIFPWMSGEITEVLIVLSGIFYRNIVNKKTAFACNYSHLRI